MATLQIGGDGIAEWAPGNLVVKVGGGTPNLVATILIDGVPTGQETTLAADGTIANLTVVLFDRYSVGPHTLTITTSADTGSLPITVQKTVPTPAARPTPPPPVAQQVPGQWQFEDPVLHEVYVLPVNPTTASVPFPGRTLADRQTTTGHPVTTEGILRSVEWAWEGYIADQDQYDAFQLWADKPYRIYITDDLGRQFIGVIIDFAPSPWDPHHTADGNFVRSHYGMTIEVMKEVT